MSYDLHLFRTRAGVDLLRAAEESINTAERELPGPLDPENELRRQALAAALQLQIPELEGFTVWDNSTDLADEGRSSKIFEMISTVDSRIQIILFDETADISVPYWYSGEEACAVWQEVWACLVVLEREGEFHTFDPQLGSVLALDLDRPAVLETYRLGYKVFPGVTASQVVSEHRSWWSRLFYGIEHRLRSSVGLSPSEVKPRLRNQREIAAQFTEIVRRHVVSHPVVAGRTETIVLQMVVTSEGGAEQVEVVTPECDPDLVEEAISVGTNMRFRPARVGRVLVPVQITVPITLRFPG